MDDFLAWTFVEGDRRCRRRRPWCCEGIFPCRMLKSAPPIKVTVVKQVQIIFHCTALTYNNWLEGFWLVLTVRSSRDIFDYKTEKKGWSVIQSGWNQRGMLTLPSEPFSSNVQNYRRLNQRRKDRDSTETAYDYYYYFIVSMVRSHIRYSKDHLQIRAENRAGRGRSLCMCVCSACVCLH